MKSAQIRQKFLNFFEQRGHAVLPSASLVPEHDPTVLFNTAGMQPLAPFLLGREHPKGKRLVNVQKCIRTTDIDDIGDKTHATFFEMLGNWSLGDYFKKEAIQWSYEFLTSKDQGLGLDPSRLYVTVFAGDENAPRDEESADVWKRVGVPAHRIYFKGADSNWWPAVKGTDTWTGPTGTNSEMFYDVKGDVGDLPTMEDFDRADSEQRIVEIWNDVFMEFEKKHGTIVKKLHTKNVDTGAGFERLLLILQGVDNIFDTDVFVKMFAEAKLLSTSSLRSQRIIADHLRTSVFIIADGVIPSNTDRGYVLRRLLRRAIFHTDKKDLTPGEVDRFISALVETYAGAYPEVDEKRFDIARIIGQEVEKFRTTIQTGLKEFEKIASGASSTKRISGREAFALFSTYGFPVEMTIDLARDKGMGVDTEAFEEEMKRHRDLSRSGAEQKFKGGLADTSDMSVRYHTATHLLNAALRAVLGNHVEQKGSNITPERLRFDFSHDTKLTDEEKQRVEAWVNEKIQANLPVTAETLPLSEARSRGAVGVFGERYADTVTVYTIGGVGSSGGTSPMDIVSMEICGGPHVVNTRELGVFKITKEEAVSQGVRRIKATLS